MQSSNLINQILNDIPPPITLSNNDSTDDSLFYDYGLSSNITSFSNDIENELNSETISSILSKPHTCRNCGHIGHLYKDCPHPITSFGIICYRINPETKELEYLMIQRKDSLCFMEFIRGKYELKNSSYIRQLLSGMTQQERQILLCTQFEELWNHVWYQPNIPRHTTEFNQAKTKFITLKKGFYQENKYINMQYLIQSSTSTSVEPEWGFPKGRRRIREEDINCALREFSEETGLQSSDVKLDKSFNPYEEIFYGTNFILYRHVYYVGCIETYGPKSILVDTTNVNQAREVRSIEWFTYNEAVNHIRDHNKERKEIFKQINKKLLEKFNV
jgi:8-oxo-dGTP pyrophosphatase MutT (NUDIX family)